MARFGTPIENALSSRNGLVRKAAAAALQVPRWWHGLRARLEDFSSNPPVLANSFPKSGTHLLFQIVDGLPNATNYGLFLASMTSSFRFRERLPDNAAQMVRGFVPGEIVRGHLFFDTKVAAALRAKNAVHYFAYRDPRDVVVSEAHYLREMNRWHRLAPHFRKLPSMADAIMLSITGFDPPISGLEYPNVAERFARYAGWLQRDDCMPVRFEDLAGENRPSVIRQMAEFYAGRCSGSIDVAACVEAMTESIAPHKSHTFRSGKKAGWQREFTAQHHRVFAQFAGDLLIELGYEPNHDWAKAPIQLPSEATSDVGGVSDAEVVPD